MRENIRKLIIITLIVALGVGVFWRCMQLCGLLRCIPTEALELYEECQTEYGKIGLSGLNVRCPYCWYPITAVYYGLVDTCHVEYNQDGHSLWEWRGCISDGTCWTCNRCGKRFNKKGKTISFLNKSRS